MGYAISWIAFKDRTTTQAADLLELSRSGQFEEVPESMFTAAELKNGWCVVIVNKFSDAYVDSARLHQLSRSNDIVSASIEEHVMYSNAEAWKNGKLMWKVSHVAEHGRDHLEEHGFLPQNYASIKERLIAAQRTEDAASAEVDYIFDLPLDLAEAIVGFMHDKNIDAPFEILISKSAKPKGGLLSRLLGK